MTGKEALEQLYDRSDSKQLGQVVLEAINEGLSVLGESYKAALYYHLEKQWQIKREETCNKIEAFDKALNGLLEDGAEIIGRQIAKSLYEKLGLSFKEHKNWTLADYIDDAKKAIESRRTDGEELDQQIRQTNEAKDHVIMFPPKHRDKHMDLFT